LVGGLLAVGTWGATAGEGEALPAAECQSPSSAPSQNPSSAPSRGAPAPQPSQPASRQPEGLGHPTAPRPGEEGHGGCTDGVPACLAGLGEEAVEAAAAAGPAAPHHVALPAQGHLALQAAEVLRVPAPALRLDALLHEDQLEGGETTHPLSTQLENP